MIIFESLEGYPVLFFRAPGPVLSRNTESYKLQNL